MGVVVARKCTTKPPFWYLKLFFSCRPPTLLLLMASQVCQHSNPRKEYYICVVALQIKKKKNKRGKERKKTARKKNIYNTQKLQKITSPLSLHSSFRCFLPLLLFFWHVEQNGFMALPFAAKAVDLDELLLLDNTL